MTVFDAVAEPVAVALRVADAVKLGVGLGLGEAVRVALGLGVGLRVGVAVRVGVKVGVPPQLTVTPALEDWAARPSGCPKPVLVKAPQAQAPVTCATTVTEYSWL